MSEIPKTETTSAKPSRREFLKLLAGVTAGVALGSIPIKVSAPAHETKETDLGTELSFTTIKIQSGDRSSKEKSLAVLHSIEKALKTNPSRIVLTPEFSFFVNEAPLIIRKVSDCYEVDPKTAPFQQEMVSKLKSLAKDNKCTIFAATFNTKIVGDREERNTLLNISPDGKIVGVKHKDYITQRGFVEHPPEGNWTISYGPKKLKVLPLICGELVWHKYMGDDGKIQYDDQGKSAVPDYIRMNAPYDLLIHPQNQADVRFGEVADSLQNNAGIPPSSAGRGFTNYYGEYIPLLTNGAPIMTADIKIAAVMRSNLTAFSQYVDNNEYVFAK